METSAKRVLLAEDDRFLRRAFEVGLGRRGFTILAAADGEEALRLARTGAPDVILLDLVMPKLPGLEVLRALRAEPATRGIPVLVLSNSAREGDVEAVTALGAEYLVKAGQSPAALGERVAALLGR